jgi:hypothetical protein
MRQTTSPDLRDPDAFARVYDEHAAGVLAVARRILGEARAQDVTRLGLAKLAASPALEEVA